MKRVHKYLAILTIGGLMLPSGASAKTVESTSLGCGWEGTYLAIAQAKHELQKRRQARERPKTPFAATAATSPAANAGPDVRKVGNLVVVDDDGTLVLPANPNDMSDRGVVFKRKKNGVKTGNFGGGVDPNRGEKITIDDDDTVVVDLDFRFKFFGKRYGRIFINSDGNITLVEGDSASTERSLSRFLNGPPRIAPFFDDLDPSVATGDGGVYVDNQSKFVRVTWFDVPEFDETNSHTFQVTLFSTGKVTFAYDTLDAQEGIIGVSPGGSDVIDLVDLSTELPLGKRANAVAERFSLTEQIDDFAVAKAFLGVFKDDYDVLLVWADFPVDLGDAFAYSFTLRNDVSGIGRGVYDATSLVGGAKRFQTFVQMGDLSRYPSDPESKFLDPDSTLSLIAHEVGHRFLTYVEFEDPNGKTADLLLGRQRAHWNYFFDSDASVLEGNDIRDNGDGTFSTVAATEKYSKFDQYLMGLIAPAEVPDSFYVVGEDSSASRESNPRVGDTFSGTRVDVSLDQVIAHEGPRDPDWTTARKTLKTAFLVISTRESLVSDASIAKVNGFRKAWQPFFKQATDGTGTVKTKLKRKKK